MLLILLVAGLSIGAAGLFAGIIREAVTNDHEIFARHIVLIRPQTLPKTTSGKVQRALTRKLWQEGKLDYLTAETAA